MPRIHCQYLDCKFLEDGLCGAPAIKLDPESGCLTYRSTSKLLREDGWDIEDEIEDDDWEDFGYEEREWEDEDF